MQIDLVQQAKELWHDEFGDSPSFIERFFDLYCDDESFFFVAENGVLKSMLFILEYRLKIKGRDYKGAYLYAFCTNKAFRKQGLGSALLVSTERRLRELEFDFIFLISRNDLLIPYYNKLSFSSCFSHNMKEWAGNRNKSEKLSNYSIKSSDYFDKDLYLRFASCRDNAVMHSAKDLLLYENGGYKFYYLENSDEVLVIAIARTSEDEIIILDIVSACKEKETMLFDLIFTNENKKLLVPSKIKSRECDKNSQLYMIKSLRDNVEVLPKELYFNLLLDK